MCGNGQVRGVRYDESLPANIHFLAGIWVGDIWPVWPERTLDLRQYGEWQGTVATG